MFAFYNEYPVSHVVSQCMVSQDMTLNSFEDSMEESMMSYDQDWLKYVTEFAKRGFIHASNFATLMSHNFVCD